jgi:hypothetical protein
MRVLAYLFLRRFRKYQYTIPLIVLVVLRILLWFLGGIAEELIFSKIASHIPLSGENIAVVTGLVVGLGIVGILIWMYIDTRKEFTSQHLQDMLKEMHKQMLHIKGLRPALTQVEIKEVEAMAPVLMDKLGLIDMDEQDRFRGKLAAQIKRGVTEKSKRDGTWYYKVAGAVSRAEKELVNSRDYTAADLDIIVGWIDSQSWGLKQLRDDDKRWGKLFESIEPFTRDSRLRELIGNHIAVSYTSCNMSLVTDAQPKWRNSIPLMVLQRALIGSPLNPVKTSLALSEILADIDKRMNILNRRKGNKHK